jgi:hypothetical protein
VADFDRTIPPGGEGKITLRLNLKGYQGNVKKTATVFSNDLQQSRVTLTLQGTVKSLVEVRPSNTITFRGTASQLQEQIVTLEGASQPFHITKVENNLEGKISYQMETVEEGKQYKLKISNQMKQGNYAGYIKCSTDLPQKPLVVVRVLGYVEGEIAVRPQTILVGKLLSQQSVRVGKVLVVSNQDKPFHITSLNFDENLMNVIQQPLPNDRGFSLEITPKLENIPEGTRNQTALTIETDLTPGERYEVQVHVLNSGETSVTSSPNQSQPQPAVTKTPNEDDDEEEEEEDVPAKTKN